MAKRISPPALLALEEALVHLYWYKDDLKKFLYACLGDGSGLVSSSDWTDNKRNIVGRLIRTMAADQDKYLDRLRALCLAVVAFEDFPHLKRLEDGERRAAKAEAAVAHLRKLAAAHLGADKEREEIERRREADAERAARTSSMHKRLNEIRQAFMDAVGVGEQKRGYRLEKILYDLFSLFELDPKASFKITGEQIDGAFSFETADYILEAKWTSAPCEREDVDVFASKVERKLDNTLGLFISVNGFTPTALTRGGTGRTKIIAMTGEDLMAVLDQRISLPELLRRKRRHGVHTGEMLLSVRDMLGQN
jgi:restriction endonuclease